MAESHASNFAVLGAAKARILRAMANVDASDQDEETRAQLRTVAEDVMRQIDTAAEVETERYLREIAWGLGGFSHG